MSSLLSADCISVEFGGNEPWPDDVKLYQPPSDTQILPPDAAHSLSVQAFLKMSNLKFQLESRKNAEHMSPSGQIPFITVGAYVVSEVDPIIGFVNTRVRKNANIPDDIAVEFERHTEEGYFTGHKLSEGLSNGQLADMRAFMSLAEKILACAELYASWIDSDCFYNTTLPRYGSGYAWPLGAVLAWRKYWRVRQLLQAKGWLGLTDAQREEELHTCLQALAERLGREKYYFRERATELDALVYGHVAAVAWAARDGDGPAWRRLRQAVLDQPALVDFAQNIGREFDLPCSEASAAGPARSGDSGQSG